MPDHLARRWDGTSPFAIGLQNVNFYQDGDINDFSLIGEGDKISQFVSLAWTLPGKTMFNHGPSVVCFVHSYYRSSELSCSRPFRRAIYLVPALLHHIRSLIWLTISTLDNGTRDVVAWT